jgi:hypothetical protein
MHSLILLHWGAVEFHAPLLIAQTASGQFEIVQTLSGFLGSAPIFQSLAGKSMLDPDRAGKSFA